MVLEKRNQEAILGGDNSSLILSKSRGCCWLDWLVLAAIAKDLILSGVGNITIHDPTTVDYIHPSSPNRWEKI